MAWSLLIRNGLVIDGSGAPAMRADVAVEGGRVAAVGPGLRGEAQRTIDATGHYVTPGFIDIHSHSDLFYLGCPAAESKVRQGCTTEVVGMCSFSPAPVHPARKETVRAWAGGIGARLDVTWETFGQYLDVLRAARPSINIVHMVGHGALRLAAIGPDSRAATPDDLRAMERLLAEAVDAGAFGYSTGLVYPPSVYASTDELIALARSMAKRGGLYFSHVRGEAATLEEAIAEAIQIGEVGGVAVQIAHVKAAGPENWGKMDRVLRMIDTARARGLDVTGDVYPYNAGSTKMDNLLPPWMHDGGVPKLLTRLADRPTRRRVVDECLIDGERWRTPMGSIGFDQIFVATCSRPELEGLDLAQLARDRRHAGRGDAEPRRRGARRRVDGGLLPERGERREGPRPSRRHDRLRLARPLGGPGATPGQAPSAHVRDVPARARPLRPREEAFLLGDGGPQDDRNAGGQAPAPRPRPRAAGPRRRPRCLRSRDGEG